MISKRVLALLSVFVAVPLVVAGTNRIGHYDILELDNSGHTTTVTAGTLTGDTNFKLPVSSGTNGQVLGTNGSGTTSWVDAITAKSDASTNGYLSSTDWTTFNAKQATLPAATTSVNGYLSSTDWTTFNAKQATLPAATTSVNGYLTSTDWNTFNAKVPATRTVSTTAPITGGGDLSANRTVAIPKATSLVDGYLSAADWVTFNSAAGGGLLNPMTTTGDIIYSSTNTGTPSRLAVGAATTVLHGGTTPAYSAVADGDFTGQLSVAHGGTNLASGTSGGVLAYTASGTLASSGALTQNAVVIGGGAGVVPSVVTNNSTATNKFLTQSSSGTPAWATIATGDVPSPTLTSAHMFVGNASNVATDTAVTGDVTITNGGVTAIGSGKVTSTMILDGTILNADVNASAAIAYSKLNLGTSIVNADVSATAAIVGSKIQAASSSNTGTVSYEAAGTQNITFTSGPWSTSQTVLLRYARSGSVATISIPSLAPASNNTSGATTASTAASALPAAVTPSSSNRDMIVEITNAGANQQFAGFVQVDSDGSVTIRRDGSSTAWTGTTTQVNGWVGFSFSYPVN